MCERTDAANGLRDAAKYLTNACCWMLGGGFTTETALAALYDTTLSEPIPDDMKELLAKLK